jgi:hypothetical protein
MVKIADFGREGTSRVKENVMVVLCCLREPYAMVWPPGWELHGVHRQVYVLIVVQLLFVIKMCDGF